VHSTSDIENVQSSGIFFITTNVTESQCIGCNKYLPWACHRFSQVMSESRPQSIQPYTPVIYVFEIFARKTLGQFDINLDITKLEWLESAKHWVQAGNVFVCPAVAVGDLAKSTPLSMWSETRAACLGVIDVFMCPQTSPHTYCHTWLPPYFFPARRTIPQVAGSPVICWLHRVVQLTVTGSGGQGMVRVFTVLYFVEPFKTFCNDNQE